MTYHDRATSHVGALLRAAKAAPGTPQAGNEWGTGENRRTVTITYDGDERFSADLIAWGYPIRTVTGTAGEVFSEAIDAYGV